MGGSTRDSSIFFQYSTESLGLHQWRRYWSSLIHVAPLYAAPSHSVCRNNEHPFCQVYHSLDPDLLRAPRIRNTSTRVDDTKAIRF
jgi:hypothetical protein